MYCLQATKRDGTMKAKKLRKNGFVPGNIFGGRLEHPVSIQIPEGEARKLLRVKGRGGNITVDVEGEKYNVIVEQISYVVLNDEIEHIGFQNLAADQVVMGTAQVVIKNRDLIETVAEQQLEEISYKALPKHLVEEVEVDIAHLKPGTIITLEELDMFKNPDIEVLTPGDRVVVSIAEKMQNVDLPEEEEEEEESIFA